MKKAVFPIFALLLSCSAAFGQVGTHNADGSGKVVLDNDKVEVVEYIGKAQGAVCGLGEHHHKAHLTVALTDAQILITAEDGGQQQATIPAGAAIWFDAGTHSAMNSGNQDTRLLLVYLKD